jgi:hypothetical protein
MPLFTGCQIESKTIEINSIWCCDCGKIIGLWE